MHTAKGIAELLHPQQPRQRNHQENLLHAHQLTPAPWPVKAEVGGEEKLARKLSLKIEFFTFATPLQL